MGGEAKPCSAETLARELHELAATPGLKADIQQVLALLGDILARAETRARMAEFEARLCAALAALRANPPNVAFAKDVAQVIDRKTMTFGYEWENRRLRKVSDSPIAVVNMAMPVTIIVFAVADALTLAILFTWKHRACASGDCPVLDALTEPAGITMTWIAFLAGIISLLQRASSPAELRTVDLVTLYYTTIWKPMIAAFSAWAAFFILEAGIGLAPSPGVNKPMFYIVMGFLIGLSERFAGDILARAERATVAGSGRGG